MGMLLRTLYEVLHEVHTIKIRFHHCNDKIIFVRLVQYPGDSRIIQEIWHRVAIELGRYFERSTKQTYKERTLFYKNGNEFPPGREGYSIKWPIHRGSTQKGYLFQASGILKGRDFTTWSAHVWKSRENSYCLCSLWMDQKGLTGEI